MRNFKSTMRGYIFLGIFALVMTVIMGLGQISINKMNDDVRIDRRPVSTEKSHIVVEEILEIEKLEYIPENQLMASN